MIELSPEIITAIMIGGVLLGVMTGFPLGAVVGSIGLISGYLVLGDATFQIIYSRVYSLAQNYPLLAVPLFTFMGIILQRSGIAAGLYDALYLLLGKFKGGLAISTVLVGTVLAACLGVVTASVTMLTLIALGPMLSKGYDKSLSSGSICAGGTLGILIPPSVMLVIYGPMAGISVGKLFMGAIFPGVILSALYCIYIGVKTFIHPELAPPLSVKERQVPLTRKMTMLVTSIIPPVILFAAVMGSIFFGIAPPTEAASVGAFASVLMALAYRKLSWKLVKYACVETMRISGFVFFIGCLAFAFVGIFMSVGGGDVITNIIMSVPFGKWGAFIVMMFIVFILGMFIDWIGIIFIMVPLLSPIAPALGFDPIWFAIMVCVNLQMSFLSPPFAISIFTCKGSAAPELGLTTADIIRGVIPFIVLIVIGIGLCILFPQLITWLPGHMIK